MGLTAMKVPTVFTAVDRFSQVVSKMTSNVSAFGNAAEAAAMRTSRKMNALGTTMLSAGAGMAVGIGIAVNEAGKFEKSISNISTLTENTPAQMKAMGDSILSISNKIPVALSELTEGGYDVVSAGITGTANQLNVLNRSAILAVAGLGTTKEAVDITTSSLNAFGIEASNSERVTNLLMKTVKYGKTTVSGIAESFGSFASIMKNSGVTLDEYLASAAALTTTGMSMSRAQTQVSSATTALIKPNESMLKIYKRLGVKDIPAFIKQNGGLVGSLDLVDKTAKKMGLNMSKVLGRKEGLSALLSLLGAQKGKFLEIMGDMSSGADVVNTAFAKQQKTFSAQFQVMKNKTVALAVAIGTELIPMIISLIDKISPMITGLIDWVKNNKWLAKTIFYVTVGLLALGAAAKVGAVLFYGISKAIALYNLFSKSALVVTGFMSLGLEGMATAATFATASLWTTIAAFLAFVGPILAVIAVLGTLGYIMYKSGQTSKKFAEDKAIHLKIVSGEYESMESRIAKSNDRIVANMKKFKLDMESVKKTGKTISELRGERMDKSVKYNESSILKNGLVKSSSSLSTAPKNLTIPKIITDSDEAFNDIMNEKKNVNTAGSKSANLVNDISSRINKQQVEVIIKDPGSNAESVKVNGKNYSGGIPARTGSTTGVKN